MGFGEKGFGPWECSATHAGRAALVGPPVRERGGGRGTPRGEQVEGAARLGHAWARAAHGWNRDGCR